MTAKPPGGRPTSGVVHLGFLSRLALGPVTFSFVVDSTGTYAWSWARVTALFVLGAIVATAWMRSDRR